MAETRDVRSGEALDAVWDRIVSSGLVTRLLELARDEDLGPEGRDVTADVMLDLDERTIAALRFRESGVVAGVRLIAPVLDAFGVGDRVDAQVHASDGTRVEAGATVATLRGSSRAIVTVERTLLNLVGRLSGVATRTAEFAARIPSDRRARLCDTRKTTPGLRVLEKYAVRCGCGVSHRMGLHDGVLVKDNHIAAIPLRELAERLADAAGRAREMRVSDAEGRAQPLAFFEVEVDSLEQFDRVLAVERGLIDYVLLDNFTTSELREAVRRRDGSGSRLLLEASGGVTLDTIASIAETGVERISVGSLTHHAVSLDVGLDIDEGDD